MFHVLQGHRLVCPSSGTKCFLKAERDEAALVGRGQGGGQGVLRRAAWLWEGPFPLFYSKQKPTGRRGALFPATKTAETLFPLNGDETSYSSQTCSQK